MAGWGSRVAKWALAAMALGGAAEASPPPIGHWANSSEFLMIEPNGSCGFGANGKVTAAGYCSWNPSNAGILTLTYQWVRGPGHIYWSVIWRDRNTITLDGDPFYRQQ